MNSVENTLPSWRLSLAKEIAKITFHNDKGDPLILTDGQAAIFASIYWKLSPRIQVIAPTQYGKSNTISTAILLRSQQYKEDFAIVTGEQKKSDTIMAKMIEHLFDNPLLLDNLELDRNEPLDRIRRERTRKRIVWKDGGSVMTVTANAGNRKAVTSSLSGLGSPNIIEDEASLIPDDLQAMVLRMLGGHQGGFLMKIGNPYTRGHFLKTWQSDRYQKIFIDYQQGLKEGRYTPEFIEEMRQEAFFDVLYECQFPKENEIDFEGFRLLLGTSDIEVAFSGLKKHEGEKRLGFDIGEGGDESVGILRSNTRAEVIHLSKISDLMAMAGVIHKAIKDYGVEPENCFIDDTGIGAGIVDRLHEIGLEVSGIKWASKPRKDTYLNLKAENYWNARTWLKEGGCLTKHEGFYELAIMRYGEDSSGKTRMKTKEAMRKEGIKSPNVADAFALTFNKVIDEIEPRVTFI